MAWDIAAGIVIGGFILLLLRHGIKCLRVNEVAPGADNWGLIAEGYASIVVSTGLAIWVIFFKAHYGP